MKLKPLHIIVLFLIFINHGICNAIILIQEPEQTRVFENGFQDHYKGRKYNYEGEKIVNKTPGGSGDYADYKDGKTKRKEKNDSENLSINLGPFGWLFYLALAAAVVFLVYTVLNEGGTGLFTSKRNKSISDPEEITAENIEHADIHALIKQAEKNEDYRLAVRYYYLLILKTLSLKNYIKVEDDKTNADYLDEVSTKPFSDKFSYALYLYNYIWYGKFPVNIKQYNKAKNNFSTLLNAVK